MKEFNIDTLVQKVPNRLVNSHKGDYGKALIIAGTKGMGGAGILSSEACVFCGAGLVTLVTHPENVQASLERNPEVMVSSEKNNTQEDDNKIALCGPGLGEDNWSEKFFKKFYRPFILTYLLFSIAISFYPSFNFYSIKGQLIIFAVSIFNGILGVYVKKL